MVVVEWGCKCTPPLFVVQVLGQFTDDNIMNYARHGTSLGLGTKACCKPAPDLSLYKTNFKMSLKQARASTSQILLSIKLGLKAGLRAILAGSGLSGLNTQKFELG